MTIIELKASVYDMLAQQEFLQRKIQEINNEIAKKINEPIEKDNKEVENKVVNMEKKPL